MGTDSKRIILERIAGISILMLFVFRFVFPGDISFFLDEPQLQLILDQSLANNTIPTYGPIPLWIYYVFRQFTAQVIDLGLLHNLIFTSPLLVGFYFCKRHLKRGADL
ncbi:MAG: hypothetical protein KA715_03740 [Xanthomonadaceae bacterium]|nr:hypothetical protein [Xanthomonadaceae bacterium]